MKILITVLLIGLLFILGCSKISRNDYIIERDRLTEPSKNICNLKGQDYLTHYTPDLREWKVICYQISPFKSFEYEITA